ncbi:methionine synthase [candidate division KSB1 bacterium]|nr:methionine synthase [candidate division KSB1 bacterium]
MTFRERLQQGVVVFDGAMGTQIQALQPTNEEWDNKLGCSEVLNLTVPEKIQKIHEAYLAAGSDVVETNTFGANAIVLAEYDLQDRVEEINRVAVQLAKNAARKYNSDKPRFVAGSIGPGTKLITLGQVDYDTMYNSYSRQAHGLIESGVDLFVIETCQDLLQIKIALLAVRDKMRELNYDVPIAVTVTVETTGTLLIGSEIGAVLAALEPFDVDILGMNCATGPEHMHPYVTQICKQFNGYVMVQPNAGLPQNVGGEMVYTLSIETFVNELSGFVRDEGVHIVGGCCGTTPKFIRALHNTVENIYPATRTPDLQPSVASIFSAQTLRQDPAPFFVGERTNTNGSKKFREYLLENDWDGIVAVAQQQQRTGAHGLDLCVAYTGRDEIADMKEAATRIIKQVNLPLFLDSTDVAVIETALKLYGGRAVINSINLEDGEGRADAVCQLARRYGAGLIALTIDEKGMALEAEKKLAIAKRIYDIAVKRHGMRASDLIFDALTFTLGSGDATLKDSAIHTMNGIRMVKEALPGVSTLLGLSNVSFGLNPYSREILNSVFLAEAVKAGLDMAIVNVQKIIPLYQINDDDKEHALNLIYNRTENALIDFINHFDAQSGKVRKTESDDDALSLEEKIKQRVIRGNSSGMEKLLMDALETRSTLDIINDLLIPAMKVVGDLFGAGEMQLPFVLQAAEVMKASVDKLQPYMEKTDAQSQTSIVLATVRGDVHDIGKNLVDIILSNNGYKVYNLGIKCEIDAMLEKATAVNADAIGMSGLLVKSTVVMKEYLEEMKRRGINVPVLLGGAALTRSYVEDVCDPIIDAPVTYCTDAFDGLKMMQHIQAGNIDALRPTPKMQSSVKPKSAAASRSEIVAEAIRQDIEIPIPPFWGDRIVSEIELDTVYHYLTEPVLFRGRWGFRRGKISKEEFELMIQNDVRPTFEALKQHCKDEGLLIPQLVYGYYPCNSEGDDVIVFRPNSNDEWLRFHFPRQANSPHRCIADFFLPAETNKQDLIALQVVTVGQQASDEAQRLFKSDKYKDYLLFHGLSVEVAEALAEYWHLKIREELHILEEDGQGMEDFVVQKYRGARYSFGYPACPDLAENRKIFDILQPERINVTITDGDQMVPEQTTSAFVVHHPQAKYFTV